MGYEELIKALRLCSSEQINRCADCPKVLKAGCYDELEREAADAIEELSLAQEQWITQERNVLLKSQPRWVSVTERLPEEDGMYLVHGKWSASGRKVTDTCEFYVHDGYFRAAWNFDVTHWMPPPEPPKEEA